jgi:hypothetical protein
MIEESLQTYYLEVFDVCLAIFFGFFLRSREKADPTSYWSFICTPIGLFV